MNHGGTSWWVSHMKYPCNGLAKWANPHVGFYNSQLSDHKNRTRSNEGIGGEWGEGGEYRYLVR